MFEQFFESDVKETQEIRRQICVQSTCNQMAEEGFHEFYIYFCNPLSGNSEQILRAWPVW